MVLLGIAVVLGIVVLQAFDTGPSPFSERVTTATTVPEDTEPTLPVEDTTTTTRAARPAGEVKVLVANGTGIRGFGSKTANELKALGYNTLAPVDTTRALDATSIQYADDFQAEALAVAQAAQLPANVVQPLNSPPVADVRGANVLVLLGSDNAPTTTTTAARRATTTTRRAATTTTTRRATTTTPG